jgi:hypothetical protein
MTRGDFKKLIEEWRSTHGGIEVVVKTSKPFSISARVPSIEFDEGPEGFAWIEIAPGENLHVVRLDAIDFDRVFEAITIRTSERSVDIQPLRTEEIVAFVEKWKKDNSNRLDASTILREAVE